MRIPILFTLALVFTTYFSWSQNSPINAGGGLYTLENHGDNCLTDEDRTRIRSLLRENTSRLMAEGKLTVSDDREEVQFIWPLQKSDSFEWNSYYGISAHLDQDETPGLGDYNCSERTYDGHRGTDIFTWPFPWLMVENDYVEIIAGAEGVIIAKDDGFEDDHCSCYGSWNAVYVQHEDGSVAWYGHMKNGSLTDKEVGDDVAVGEYLGVVASSGCSTGPHLHLEVYDGDVNLIDPFAGSCNELNDETWWEDQHDFREPTINTILTHDAIPEHGCPTVNEDPHISNEFYPEDEVVTAVYFHDALSGTFGNYRLYDAEGTLWNDWSNTMGVTYNASWWYWTWYLPEDGPFGVWRFEADYEGETVTHEFNYGVYANLDDSETHPFQISPNPVSNGFFNVKGINTNAPGQLFDATGKMVKTVTLGTGDIDVSNLAEGLYILHFQVEDLIVTEKIIIGGQH